MSAVLSPKVMWSPFNQPVECLHATLLVKGKLASVVYRSWRVGRSNEHNTSIKQEVLGRTNHKISFHHKLSIYYKKYDKTLLCMRN
jgi:hypothetical protein